MRERIARVVNWGLSLPIYPWFYTLVWKRVWEYKWVNKHFYSTWIGISKIDGMSIYQVRMRPYLHTSERVKPTSHAEYIRIIEDAVDAASTRPTYWKWHRRIERAITAPLKWADRNITQRLERQKSYGKKIRDEFSYVEDSNGRRIRL